MHRHKTVGAALVAIGLAWAGPAWAKDLGDILLDKGLISAEDLKKAREEDPPKTATPKLPKWLETTTLFGDLRVRYEAFFGNHFHGDHRGRVRARIGLAAKVSDEIAAAFRLASGNPDDPISANQSFEKAFTHKPVAFDQAYLTFKPGKSFALEPGLVTIAAGKFGGNVYKPSELVWDDDLNVEGATESLKLWEAPDGVLRGVRLAGFQWVIDNVAGGRDPWVGGGQVAADAACGKGVTWSAAIADYHFSDVTSGAGFLTQNKIVVGNDVVTNGTGKVVGTRYGFNVVNASAELNFADPAGAGVPMGLFGDLAHNTQADGRNMGFFVGAGIGKAGTDWYRNGLKTAGDWGASYTFAWVEKNAVLSTFNFSDMDYNQGVRDNGQKGGVNVTAHLVRMDYELLDNLQLTAKMHLINALDRAVSNATLHGNPTLVRTQLDAVLKF